MTFVSAPDTLVGWTIYSHPSDLPNHFVVRAWRVGPIAAVNKGMVEHAAVGCLCATLVEARGCLPPHLTNLHRWLTDDPVIVETWI